MTAEVPGILARIVSRKREEVAAKEPQRRSLEQSAAYQTPQRRAFRTMLERRRPALIAEIKRASPSRGLLAAEFNPAERARQYFQGGAAAISVLTDRDFFQGSMSDLKTARSVAPLPVLRKDFTIAEIDVIEAAAAGADAILLITAILETGELRRLRALAARYEMASLVEVHDEAELERALESGAEIVGVNNRDLRTFEVRLETSERLAALIPAGVLRVAESGIRGREDLKRLAASGYDAFLVGEHLMKSGDPAAALKALQDG